MSIASIQTTMRTILFSIILAFFFVTAGYTQTKNLSISPHTLSDLLGDTIENKEEAPGYPYAYYKSLSQASQFIDTQQYNKALELYTLLKDTYGNTIDISIGNGEVYYHLGNYDIASTFFKESMQYENFTMHAQWAFVYYRIAVIAYSEGDEQAFQRYLTDIITRDTSSDVSMNSIVNSRGLDVFVTYFSLNPTYAYEAYRELGIYLILSKRDVAQGLQYLLTALAMMVTWGADDVLQVYDNTDSFTDIQYFLERLKKTVRGRTFLKQAEVVRVLRALEFYFHTYTRAAPQSRLPVSNVQYIKMLRTVVAKDTMVNFDSAYYPVFHL